MTGRDLALTRLAMRDLAAEFADRGHPLSERTQRGALTDAGTPDWYATMTDYRLALRGFVEDRLSRRRDL